MSTATTVSLATLEGWNYLTEAQQRRLSLIDSYAKTRGENGLGFDLIAWENGTPEEFGLPVIYIFDDERERVVQRDGRILVPLETISELLS